MTPTRALTKIPAISLGLALGEPTPEAWQSALNGYLVAKLIFGVLLVECRK